jgi:hypothetical protein
VQRRGSWLQDSFSPRRPTPIRGSLPDTTTPSTRSTSNEAAAGLGRLSERVVELEKKVDRLSMPDLRPGPTDAELKRARLEQERQAEFLNKVWTGP